MNWLINDSAEQVDQINHFEKQVDTISDYEKLVDARNDTKSDRSSNPKVATHTTNGKFTQNLLISRFVPKIIPVVIGPIKPLFTANVVGVQDILSPRHTVLLKASVTDAACTCALIFRIPGKVSLTGRDRSTPWDVKSDENSRLSSPSPGSNPNSFFAARLGNQEIISPSHPGPQKGARIPSHLTLPLMDICP